MSDSDTCDICGAGLFAGGSTVTVDGETIRTCPGCDGSAMAVQN